MSIHERKRDHIRHTIDGHTQYDHETGFNTYRLIHNALPELALSEISTVVSIGNKTCSMPVFVSSMTGGTVETGQVNRMIAEVCQDLDLPMGVGSQRIMLEDPSVTESFSLVRKSAPDIYIAANIGGVQIRNSISSDHLRRLIDSIEANALIVHLNPLQELMQPEGDRDFTGILKGIEYLVNKTPVPIIVKETGAGINGATAKRLYNAGVRCIDIAGSGGTSWSKVESIRQQADKTFPIFDNWGIPTATCLREIQALNLKDIYLIASGGIRTSMDILKAIALGANMTALAQPIIRVIHESGQSGMQNYLLRLKHELSMGLLLMGVRSITELNSNYIYISD